MFKVVYVARFRPDKPLADAQAHWTDVHGALGLRLEGLAGYVQNHALGRLGPTGPEPERPSFDGYACEWWESREAYERGMASPEWAEVVADGPLVFDPTSIDGMAGALVERVQQDGPLAPFKAVVFARFHPDLSREEADRHWAEEHAELARRVPGMERYVQNVVWSAIDRQGISDGHVGFDCFSEAWFQDEDAYRAALASAEWTALAEDGRAFLDPAGPAGMGASIEERILRAPPAS